jgi:hypothetical protein
MTGGCSSSLAWERMLEEWHQIFHFGKLAIVLEGDVVFCQKESAWVPLSLDD